MGDKQITAATLQAFCSTNTERPTIAHPWTAGGYSYATDGSVLLRLPAIDGVPENPEAPKVGAGEKYAFSWEHYAQPESAWLDLPARKLVVTPCAKCGGKGRVDKCPRCGNTRTVRCICTDCGHTHEADCPVCSSGTLYSRAWLTPENECMICEGRGTVDPATWTTIGGFNYADKYLALIGEHLSRAQIIPAGLGAAMIRFAGGVGYLMPMR